MAYSSQQPFEEIEVTAQKNRSVYEVFKTYGQLGDIRDIQEIFVNGIKKYRVWLVLTVQGATESPEITQQDSFHRPPPDQHSPLNIVNILNDDCLLDIFERVDASDLYTLAWVCSRFRPIATRVFHTNDKREKIDVYSMIKPKHGSATLSNCVRFLRIFQPTSFTLDMCLNQNIVLQRLAEYSTDLEDLDLLRAGALEPQTLVALRPLLPKLRCLRIVTSSIPDKCTNVEWQLEELYIRFDVFWAGRYIKTPRLTKLHIASCGGADESRIFTFLARNGQVTQLKFYECFFSWAGWCKLAACVPNVERLTIELCRIRNENREEPDIFKCLTACVYDDLEKLHWFMKLLVGAPVNSLQLKGNQKWYSDVVDTICGLTSITKLSIGQLLDTNRRVFDRRYASETQLRQITSSLNGLRELHIEECECTLHCIRDILEEAKALNKLYIALCRNNSLEFEPAIMEDISALIAARSKPHNIHIWVFRICLPTPCTEWIPYKKWLKVVKNKDYLPTITRIARPSIAPDYRPSIAPDYRPRSRGRRILISEFDT